MGSAGAYGAYFRFIARRSGSTVRAGARLPSISALLVLAALLPRAASGHPVPDPVLAELITIHRSLDAAAIAGYPGGAGLRTAAGPVACPSLLNHTFNRLQTGTPESLCRFRGSVLLVVNTASYCGYTNQYEALEALYRKYGDRGLVVVGFPSDDFAQEPATNREIAEFCRTTYGVRFPMFEKGSVTKLADNPFYAQLAAKTGTKPRWNFHKYVIDRNGAPIASFTSEVRPDDRDLVRLIERLLAEKPGAAKS